MPGENKPVLKTLSKKKDSRDQSLFVDLQRRADAMAASVSNAGADAAQIIAAATLSAAGLRGTQASSSSAAAGAVLDATQPFNWQEHKNEVQDLLGAQPPTPGFAADDYVRCDGAQCHSEDKRPRLSGSFGSDIGEALLGDEETIPAPGTPSGPAAPLEVPPTPEKVDNPYSRISASSPASDLTEAKSKELDAQVRSSAEGSRGDGAPDAAASSPGDQKVAAGNADPFQEPVFDFATMMKSMNAFMKQQFDEQNKLRLDPMLRSQMKVQAEVHDLQKSCVKHDDLQKLDRKFSEELKQHKKDITIEIKNEVRNEVRKEMDQKRASASEQLDKQEGGGRSHEGQWDGPNSWNENFNPWSSKPAAHIASNIANNRTYWNSAYDFEPELIFVRGWSQYDKPSPWNRPTTQSFANALVALIPAEHRDSVKPLVFNDNHRLTLKIIGDGTYCRKMKSVVERATYKLQASTPGYHAIKFTVAVQPPPEERVRRGVVSQNADLLRQWAANELKKAEEEDQLVRLRVTIAWGPLPSIKMGAVTVGKFKICDGSPEPQWTWLDKNLCRVLPGKTEEEVQELRELSSE
mmetsp:Transcript_128116/g.319713  ORF Transcript_128116/g.319713 Transcript_128116/m.319713 type:complete len:578 (-) Transcript_128116:214-1947(-)|eukprot:CAMPEP_0115249294 /NCGR_PEP_ID=MMETSP0270-20121206/42517_1 /TAXON_ID=71861 /ORGANISM="Scrippsiella trochoidea, Strain CCMP3099" /LENGTH=577 /DNA_ID=CAMNT_0002664633 /DNA_START=334 /DNA_END=2067 /DNA_ORIENTATION=+